MPKHVIKQAGFTLIELIFVIAILSIISSIILVNLEEAREKARDTQRLSDMRQIRNALELYFEENGHYPGNASEGIANEGEQLGDDNGAFEQALDPYLKEVPKDPLHDGTVYFYSYDPEHCTDAVSGSCDCAGPTGAVLAFNKKESEGVILRKDTCSGGDQNQNNADYNVVLTPAPE